MSITKIMTSNQEPFEGVSKGFLVLLAIWFFIFAVGDLVTTFWLILHDPSGIANEGNPFAVSIYNGGGFLYLLLAKIGVCFIIELAFILSGSKYSRISWFHSALESIILAFICYSLIITYNNFLCILTIQAYLSPTLLKDLLVTETGMLILALILNNILLYLSRTKQKIMYVEANLATLLFLAPLIIWRPFFQWYLREQPLFYFAYLGSVLTILAIAFYIIDEIIKERRTAKPREER